MRANVLLLAFGLALMARGELSFAEPFFLQVPESYAQNSNECVRLDASQAVRIACRDDGVTAVRWAEDRFGEWFAGVRNALYTLRQMAQANRGTERVEHYLMPSQPPD